MICGRRRLCALVCTVCRMRGMDVSLGEGCWRRGSLSINLCLRHLLSQMRQVHCRHTKCSQRYNSAYGKSRDEAPAILYRRSRLYRTSGSRREFATGEGNCGSKGYCLLCCLHRPFKGLLFHVYPCSLFVYLACKLPAFALTCKCRR
jgi:hypothetical protein